MIQPQIDTIAHMEHAEERAYVAAQRGHQRCRIDIRHVTAVLPRRGGGLQADPAVGTHHNDPAVGAQGVTQPVGVPDPAQVVHALELRSRQHCPFHALAQKHTDLVCDMNLCLLEGLLTGLGASHLQAHLKPEPGHCCVRLELAKP